MKCAERKKLKRQFKVGDVVTWGLGRVSHRIIEVKEHGVIVDAISEGYGLLFVSFDKNNRNRSGRGPVRHSLNKPDSPGKIDENFIPT